MATTSPLKRPTYRQAVENREISAAEINAKSLVLSGTPVSPGGVILEPMMGPNLMVGIHYAVSGGTVSWNGLGLDGIIAEGDNYRIQYETMSFS